MGLNIISNYAANVAHRNLSASDEAATRSLSKLSSGTRVVSARDDAASMAIGARLNSEVQSLKMATVNVGQANSMLQIADGGMATIDDILVRMKTLSVQASSQNLSSVERGFAYSEFDTLRDELDRVADSTKFNGIQLLAGKDVLGIDPTVFSAGAADIGAAAGFVSFDIASDANGVKAADEVTVDVTTTGTTTVMTLTNSNTGLSQSIDVTEFAAGGDKALTGTQTDKLSFGQLGITVTLNANFSTTTVGAGIDSGTDAATLTIGADAGAAPELTFKIGSGNDATQDDLKFQLTITKSTTLGTAGGQKISDITNFDDAATASAAIEVVGDAISQLQTARSAVGVGQNRLDFASKNLASSIENNESARSTLLDLDVAAEMTSFSSKQILVQSGVAMLAQANQMPQNLLRLLQ
ncbi:flagellin N-terminal helical domain-containing protein [Thalassospira lucentensis]|uniref:flagellin N-terminal helical domain-containing protein n=1 Tax=Thalassospira lucentensis TaxID=168935 RepID=UPI00142E4D0D|nr:flagellin [Thalassospira lucentensis]NIZ01398.1 flagellin [Thalassospira lucentensis]